MRYSTNVRFDGTMINAHSNGIGNDAKNLMAVLSDRYDAVELIRFRKQKIVLQNERIVLRPRKFSNGLMMLLGLQEKIWEHTDIFVKSQINAVCSPNAKFTITRIHDIFPITNPEWFTKFSVIYFKRCFNAVKEDDLLICNSNYTRDRLLSILKNPSVEIEVLHCTTQSQQFSNCGFCEGCEVLLVKKYGIAIGTLEPRKNYLTLIKAWKNYRTSDSSMDLILIGRYGWKQKHLKKILKSKSITGLTWISNACDGSLDRLTDNASFFVSTSFDEGFNIPAAEACKKGLALILSDNSVHRETHPEATFFLKDSFTELSKILLEIAKGHLNPPKCINQSKFGIDRFKSQFNEILDKHNL